MIYLLRSLIFLVFVHNIHMSGSPVLIKMDGKKGGKGKGNLILISGGKCGSPTLIKGGGKKGGSEMILVGGQNGDCEKPKVHVVKQFVPIPYYIPKPVFKYILRHHYVPVRQVVVKPVPVPYPVKSYGGSSGGYKSGGSGGSSGGGYSGGGGSSYQNADSGYGSGYDDNSYSGSSLYGKYAPFDDKGALSSTSSYGSGSYKRQFYETNSYIPTIASSSSKSTSLQTSSMAPFASTAAALTGANLKASASENYMLQSQAKPPVFNDDYGGHIGGNLDASATTTGGSNGYQLYAPVYQGPNGQLYSSGQVIPSNYLNNSTSTINVMPSAIAKSAMYSSPAVSMAQTSTNASRKSLKKYKSEIDRAKKMLTGFAKREDSAESSSSSTSEEDSTEKASSA